MSSLRIWHNYSVGEWSIVGQWSNVVCYHSRFTIHGLLTSSMRPSEGQAQFSHSHNRRHFDRHRRKGKCPYSPCYRVGEPELESTPALLQSHPDRSPLRQKPIITSRLLSAPRHC